MSINVTSDIILKQERRISLLDETLKPGRGFFAFLEKNGTSAEVIYTTLDKELTFNTITYDPNTMLF